MNRLTNVLRQVVDVPVLRALIRDAISSMSTFVVYSVVALVMERFLDEGSTGRKMADFTHQWVLGAILVYLGLSLTVELGRALWRKIKQEDNALIFA